MSEAISERIKEKKLPNPRSEPFDPKIDLPSINEIMREVTQREIINAKKNRDYIGTPEEELGAKIENLIQQCFSEITNYENVSRKPTQERLESLKNIADNITHIVNFSAPGDYDHLFKDDRYKDIVSTFGADRLRADQSAILAIVIAAVKENNKNRLAGKKEEWSDQELLCLLDQPYLTDTNTELMALRVRARETLLKSEVKLVYTGRPDEVEVINDVLNRDDVFIPKECVDIIDPEGIDSTLDQICALKAYLKDPKNKVKGVIQPFNIQGVRSSGMADALSMIPEGIDAYVYAMATKTGEDIMEFSDALEYRKNEIKGVVYYALTGKCSFERSKIPVI